MEVDSGRARALLSGAGRGVVGKLGEQDRRAIKDHRTGTGSGGDNREFAEGAEKRRKKKNRAASRGIIELRRLLRLESHMD